VVQLLPRTYDEKISVELVSPAPSSLADASSTTGANQLKLGSVMKNKITNNIVFAKKLASQEKLEIPFSYTVQWPHDQHIGIN
jgi:hypothetical protein